MIHEKFLGPPKKRSIYHLRTSLCHVVSDLPMSRGRLRAIRIWMKVVSSEITEPMEIHDCLRQTLDVISDISKSGAFYNNKVRGDIHEDIDLYCFIAIVHLNNAVTLATIYNILSIIMSLVITCQLSKHPVSVTLSTIL